MDAYLNNGFKETEVGVIPVDWDVVLVRQIAEKPQYGHTASATEKDTGVKLLRITDITEQGVLWSSVPYCECPEDERAKYLLEKDDIVFARTGATTGKSFIVKECPEAVFASYLIRLRVGGDAMPDFVYYYFQTGTYWEQISRSKSGATQPGVNATKLENLLLPLPPLPEQRRIAAVLNAIQQDIAAQEDIIAEARAFKRSLMQRLFTYGPGPVPAETKETEIGEIPAHWELVTVEDIKADFRGAVVSGPFGSNIGKRFFVEQGVPLIRGNNLTKGNRLFIDRGFVFITKEKAEELKYCEAIIDDLIFTAAGTIGQVGLIPENSLYPKYIISNKQLRVRVNRDKALPLFLFYWFSSSTIQNSIEQRRRGTSIPVINLGILRSLPVLRPPLPEQGEIAAILADADEKIATEEDRKAALQDFFTSTLHQLMTGQIRLLSDEGVPL